MRKILRVCAVGAVLAAAGLSLAGCGSSGHSAQQSFAFSGTSLDVINDNANMPVTVSADTNPVEKGKEVTVEVHTQTMGKGAKTPAWSLNDDTLTLGSPCSSSWIGYCEASFSIQVPKGTDVKVNGKETPVG